MKKRIIQFFLYSLSLLLSGLLNAQSTDSLQAVQVQSFGYQRNILQVPAPIGYISQSYINKTPPFALTSAVNLIPGVRMEERSPNSYRLSIRGSSLRSPFGVRNVKVYWNNLPFSDAGGNTYLNIIDVAAVNDIEIIKGPSASMYGAGTGGVVLINSNPSINKDTNRLQTAINYGAYNTLQHYAKWFQKKGNQQITIFESVNKSDGYRQQSASNKQQVLAEYQLNAQQQQWSILGCFTHLYYQTPGGLTYAQMQQNPRAARLATNFFPSAITQKTSFTNYTGFAGLSHQYRFSKQTKLQSSFIASKSDISNPAIFNYETRQEQNVGARMQLHHERSFKGGQLSCAVGFEWLYNHSIIYNYGNRAGEKDTLQFHDRVNARQSTYFGQLQWTNKRLLIETGCSLGQQWYGYQRKEPITQQQASHQPFIVSPRLAVTYQLHPYLNVYGSIASGYSPPSLAEIHPSDGNFYGTLKPEYGINTEVGIKSEKKGGIPITYQLSAYRMIVNRALVRQNTSSSEYFVNSGQILYQGFEASFGYRQAVSGKKWLQTYHLQVAMAYQPYRYQSYTIRVNDYSGNKVAGVPTYTQLLSISGYFNRRISAHCTIQRIGKTPLTDDNAAVADAYHLMQLKISKSIMPTHCKWQIQASVGCDNVFNEVYGLGNDINAAGSRFYNPAAGRNFYTGLSCSL